MIEAKEIMEILRHRYPFLLVDRIVEIEEDRRAVGIKNVTINEPFFQGHFPGVPIMPGVLIVEAIAQVGGVMLLSSRREKRMIPLLGGIDNLRFRKQVFPGDQLVMEVEILGKKGNIGKCRGTARVGSSIVVEGDMLFAFIEEKAGVE
jgi:3-hydroxyacyl-[acyl-carrier-protein] dehydratase